MALPTIRMAVRLLAAAGVLASCLAAFVTPVSAWWEGADQLPPSLTEQVTAPPSPPTDGFQEIREALIRLPLAAVLGAILALRPRHHRRGRRNALVIQTQIMLSVVGAVIMLVVGQSLARAFGIVGAANLIRYRSTIDDPKDAVVMLCALAAGLAAGVGLYRLAPFATVFMAAVLWVVEYFEPTVQRRYELKVSIADAGAFRAKLESVLKGFEIHYDLMAEADEEIVYIVRVPADIRTFDVSDTIRLLAAGAELSIEWDEKKNKD